MQKPTSYQAAENLARLKVSVDKTVSKKSSKTVSNPEKEILYNLLENLSHSLPRRQPWTRNKKWQLLKLPADPQVICLLNLRNCARSSDKSYAMNYDF